MTICQDSLVLVNSLGGVAFLGSLDTILLLAPSFYIFFLVIIVCTNKLTLSLATHLPHGNSANVTRQRNAGEHAKKTARSKPHWANRTASKEQDVKNASMKSDNVKTAQGKDRRVQNCGTSKQRTKNAMHKVDEEYLNVQLTGSTVSFYQ